MKSNDNMNSRKKNAMFFHVVGIIHICKLYAKNSSFVLLAIFQKWQANHLHEQIAILTLHDGKNAKVVSVAQDKPAHVIGDIPCM